MFIFSPSIHNPFFVSLMIFLFLNSKFDSKTIQKNGNFTLGVTSSKQLCTSNVDVTYIYIK